MSIPSKLIFYKLNDQYIKISGLADGLDTDSYMDAATITATLKDRDGEVVTGFTNIVLSYVPSSNGEYIGSIQETFDPESGGGYKVYITAIQDGVQGHWEIPAEVKVRKNV